MTLVRPLAIHNIVIPASAYQMPDRMAALFALWSGVSTNWVASLSTEIDTASPGPGSYSFLLKRIGDFAGPQFNYRNAGTQATPNISLCSFGINPDGDSDPVLDSAAPAGPANFYERASNFRLVNYVKDLLVFEFDDAIAVCARHATSNLMYDVHHYGKVFIPRWVDDTSAGAAGLTMDGLGGFGGPAHNGGTSWLDNHNNQFFRLRPGTDGGDDVPSRAWYAAIIPYAGSPIGTVRTNGFTNFGPDSLTRFASFRMRTQYHHVGEWKYVKYMPQAYPLEEFITAVDGVKWFMCIGSHASQSYLWLPVTEFYDPWTPGVYT